MGEKVFMAADKRHDYAGGRQSYGAAISPLGTIRPKDQLQQDELETASGRSGEDSKHQKQAMIEKIP